MKYNELLELYKKGELDDAQRAKVTEDIEKHEAISDYLIENDDMFANDFESITTTEDAKEESDFGNTIKSAIRKAFIKAGVITSCVVLLIVFFTIFALPKIISSFYYNPSKEVNIDTPGAVYTNQLSLDYATFSELMLPCSDCDNVSVEEKGYGNYDFTLIKSIIYSDSNESHTAYGKIEKGNFKLFNSDFMNYPTKNAFAYSLAGVNTYYDGVGAAGYAEENKDYIDSLYENRVYKTFVTLDTIMSYDEFVSWSKENAYPIWVAICYKNNEGEYLAPDIIGAKFAASSGAIKYDNDKYPYLSTFSTTFDIKDDYVPGSTYKTHVISMLNYLADQNNFCKMMNINTDSIKEAANYIDKNDVYIYGFVTVCDKDYIQSISEMDHVGYIYADSI